ncbi:MAG: Flp pilus assembly complex ATPase component TadA, partial [Clostridia bacterium]|nr:Flp pilus assembly complex ATPase component TadA [Clostridia bacterium]
MVEIILKMPGQPDSTLSIPPGQYQVGSSEAVAIQLPFVGVSKLHCVLWAQESLLRVADLGSSNGTYLNGQRIGREFVNVPAGSDIEIGSVHIQVGKLTPEMRPVRTSSPSPSSQEDPENQFKSRILAVSGIPMSARPLVQEIKKQAHSELLVRLNMKRLALNSVSENDLEEKAHSTIHEILNELSIPLPEGVTQEKIENELYHEAIGLGPLEDLIARDDITEIMVNGPDNVYVEHKGILYKTDTAFADDHQVLAAIERIVSPLGRRIDESSPMVDARLKDGSRVNAIIPPLSLVGPSITIRKFAKTPLTVENLISYGSITAEIAHFLDVCVKIRKNILISGGTGS